VVHLAIRLPLDLYVSIGMQVHSVHRPACLAWTLVVQSI